MLLMLRAMLEEMSKLPTDLEPSDETALELWKAGLRGSNNEDPTLVAVSTGHRLVAFTLWLGVQPTFRMRKKVCAGVGTYVHPDWRRCGISVAIRQRAIEVARARGYTHIQGVAFNARGVLSVKKVGFKEIGSLMEFSI